MRSLLRPTLVVTALTLGSQAITLVAQSVFARFLGASSEADALFAAMTLPQYVTSVSTGALAVVLIPVFMERRAQGGDADAWRFASLTLTTTALVFVLLAVVGALFAEPLLRLAVPGLSDDVRGVAARLSLVLWPSIVALGLASMLTALHQIEGRFTAAAFAPCLGSIAYLCLLVLLVPAYGAFGAASATTAGAAVQCAALAGVMRGRGWTPAIDFSHPGLVSVARLIVPLIVSGIFIRSTVVVDRFMASELPPGSISQLGYAFRIVSSLGIAVSAGLGAVLFPPLADAIARGDSGAFRVTASRSLRAMWLAVAPIMTIAIAVAPSAIAVLYERGEFHASDTAAVSLLLRIYLVALISMSLATVTSRAIYALKATGVVAAIGAAEALAYVGYTYLLARRFGAPGIAAGFVIYYSLSMLWQGLYLRHALGATGGRWVMQSLVATTLRATACGAVAWLAMVAVPKPLWALLAGGMTGAALYVVSLMVLPTQESTDLWRIVRSRRTGSGRSVGDLS